MKKELVDHQPSFIFSAYLRIKNEKLQKIRNLYGRKKISRGLYQNQIDKAF